MHNRETTYGGSCRSPTLARVGRIMSRVAGMGVGRIGHRAETTRIPAGQQGEAGMVAGGLHIGAGRCAKVAACRRCGRGLPCLVFG